MTGWPALDTLLHMLWNDPVALLLACLAIAAWTILRKD